MAGKGSVPDAWDDNWESEADKVTKQEEKKELAPATMLSKAERILKHAETNKKIWEAAYVHPSCQQC
jgi:Tat protein secretion system quality control protein TatD with DNase activity